MTQLTTEQRQEFENYKKKHEGENYSKEVMRKVVEDDIQEHEDAIKRRATWNREYNHTPGKVESREVAEEDPENS
jgi:hypothetical protein